MRATDEIKKVIQYLTRHSDPPLKAVDDETWKGVVEGVPFIIKIPGGSKSDAYAMLRLGKKGVTLGANTMDMVEDVIAVCRASLMIKHKV